MKKFLFVITLFVSPLQAAFFVGPGATGDQFLSIPVNARPIALGDSFTAVFGDVATLQYNPAGLVGLYRSEVAAGYQSYFEGTSLQSVSIGFPVSLKLKDSGAQVGSAPFIPRDKLFVGLQYRSFNASDDARNSIGVPTGDITIKDQFFQAGLGYAPFDQVSLGASAKFIQSKIQDQSVNQLAGDAGLIWMMSDKVTWGASILNVGQDKAFIQNTDAIPTTVRAGVKWNALDNASFLSDLSEGRDKILQGSVGAEISPVSFIRFRLGATYRTELEYTGGLGLMISPNSMNSPRSKEAKVDSTHAHNTLQDLDDLAKTSDQRKSPDIQFSLDYAARVNTTIGVTHTVSFKILY